MSLADVYMLLVTLGRAKDDGMPDDATGGAMILFAPAQDEERAVNDAVRLLRDAGLQPLNVESYGTIADRNDAGYEFSDKERKLAEEAAAEQAVVVIEKQIFFDNEEVESGEELH